MKSLDELKATTDAAAKEEIEALERRILRLRGQDESLANFYEFHEKSIHAAVAAKAVDDLRSSTKAHARGNGKTSRARKLAAEIVAGTESEPKAKAKAKAKISPDQAKSRRLQGVYISLLRKFSGQEKTDIQMLAKEKGRAAAIKAMKAASRG